MTIHHQDESVTVHHGECLLWVNALEWFIHQQGLEVPTWADMHAAGWRPT